VDAVLIVDKPAGMTSHDVVARVRRIVGEKSVGHLGTLDPMATGVLPLVLGRFTRLAQFYNEADKRYEGTIRFGWATDTYDAEGQPAGPKQSAELSLQQVEEAGAEFIGEIAQFPPPFSAKKIAGIPAHRLARKGQPVELKPKQVEIKALEFYDCNGQTVCFPWHTIWAKSWDAGAILPNSSVRPSANSRLTKRIVWSNWNKLRRQVRWTNSFSIPVWCCQSFRP
jgi:tRNA pseudouridine55 synthase